MNFYSFYNLRFKSKRVHEWYNRLFVRIVNFILPIYYYITGLFISRKLKADEYLNSNDKYIVSLTSFPARIHKVWLVIESILRQKDKPDAIILWLTKREFDGKQFLPKSLLKLQKRGLQIQFCQENLMPHNKYYYTMKQYPKANVITVDDDVIYPPFLIEDLKKYHKKYPASICSTITRTIKIRGNTIQPYNEWNEIEKIRKSRKFLQLGVGGVLYPPGCLHEEVLNKKIIQEKALKADDLWLKVMSIKNETKIVSIANFRNRKFLPIIIENNRELISSNIKEGGNDKILRAILDYYELSDSVFEEDPFFEFD